MTIETFEWDPADHLADDEVAISYLEAAFETGDSDFIALAITDVGRARGRTDMAADIHDLPALIASIRSIGFSLTAKAA